MWVRPLFALGHSSLLIVTLLHTEVKPFYVALANFVLTGRGSKRTTLGTDKYGVDVEASDELLLLGCSASK